MSLSARERQAPDSIEHGLAHSGPTLRGMPNMAALYSRLAEADEADDAEALAALAWELYGLLGLDEADLTALRTRLHQLPAGPA